MAAVADTIDFIGTLFAKKSSVSDLPDALPLICIIYLLFTFLWCAIAGRVDTDFSSILTAGAGLQCLALVLLAVRVNVLKSAAGISSKMLELFVAYLCTRLTSTCIKNGYIPVDATGDFFYQFLDTCSLCCVMYILYCMHKKYKHTYDSTYDDYSAVPLAVPCLILALFVHGDFNKTDKNKTEIWDTLWATSLNLETVVMVPQMALLARTARKVDPVTCHFLGCYTLACVCRFVFWYYGCMEVQRMVPSVHILLAHMAQLVFCGNLMLCYSMASIQATRVADATETSALCREDGAVRCRSFESMRFQ